TYTANIPNDPIQFTNQSTGANTYYWNFGDGGFSTLQNPLHNYLAVGFYNVTLIAINQFNCKDTADKDIKVISDIQFPNVFTPNPNGPNGGSYNPADLSNDVFFPYTSGVSEYQLRIFNRWGELIFESRDINIGWDGYFNGKLCQQDTYVWKASVKFFDDRKFNKTGNLTLLR
ncbi:MAG: PKD domain-containing protein, partial [Bacteroidia bacterium]